MNITKTQKSGFSLLEMAIVITIIALITGGVLLGKELIEQAEDRAVINKVRALETAIVTFEEKYEYWPGDLPDATSRWGKNATLCNAAAGTASAIGTCNGDGNGSVPTAEEHLVWSHLSHTELTEDQVFDIEWADVGEPGVGIAEVGTERPTPGFGQYVELGFSFTDYGVKNAATYEFDGKYGHVLVLGSPDSTGTCLNCINAVFDSFRQRLIDEKIDDGKPGMGILRGEKGQTGGGGSDICSDTRDPTAYVTANYLDDNTCSFLFVLGR